MIVVLAESYKRQDIDSLISGPDLLRMQRLDIYTESHVDMIISDDGVTVSDNHETADELQSLVKNMAKQVAKEMQVDKD